MLMDAMLGALVAGRPLIIAGPRDTLGRGMGAIAEALFPGS